MNKGITQHGIVEMIPGRDVGLTTSLPRFEPPLPGLWISKNLKRARNCHTTNSWACVCVCV